MDRKTLRQYRALKKELLLIDQGIDRLRERAMDVPTVAGKVTGSSRDWPYIETHYPVWMDEPKEADEIRRRLRIKEKRREEVSQLAVEIEQFIAGIPDSTDRQIFELCFLEGKSQNDVAKQINLERSSIAKRIASQLSHNSQK
jgi:DNA-directed RNA polymerase specialized sigma24 family protein